jgi:hypothetical protein
MRNSTAPSEKALAARVLLNHQAHSRHLPLQLRVEAGFFVLLEAAVLGLGRHLKSRT